MRLVMSFSYDLFSYFYYLLRRLLLCNKKCVCACVLMTCVVFLLRQCNIIKLNYGFICCE